MMRRILVALILTLSVTVGGAFAASDKDYNAHFGDMDKNKGMTLDEFKAFFAHAEESKFQEADANKDGRIDHAEWHKFKEKYGYKHIEEKKK